MFFFRSSTSSGSSSGFSVQNALIGQQDMSKLYKVSTTQKIFGTVGKLCEIGKNIIMLYVVLVLKTKKGFKMILLLSLKVLTVSK